MNNTKRLKIKKRSDDNSFHIRGNAVSCSVCALFGNKMQSEKSSWKKLGSTLKEHKFSKPHAHITYIFMMCFHDLQKRLEWQKGEPLKHGNGIVWDL